MGKEKKFEILNYDELPRRNGFGAYKNKIVIGWDLIEKGFIIKTQHSEYGYNEFEFVEYIDKFKFKALYKNNEVVVVIYQLLNGEISAYLTEYKPFKKNGFIIHNNIKQDGRLTYWNTIEIGTVLRTTHNAYGYNEFIFTGYKDKTIHLIYNGKQVDTNITSFSEGQIGAIVGVITSEFKYDIGDVIDDKNRDMVIIDRKTIPNPYSNMGNLKYYKYKCNKCGFECGEHYRSGELNYDHWVEESNVVSGNGCACCSNKYAVYGINTAYDTHRWIIELGASEEWCKKHTISSPKKVKVVCKDCGKAKTMLAPNLIKYKSIGCICGDKTSYSEKFMYLALKQLKMDFKIQLNKTTFDWCNRYFYDFYVPSLNMIIETHGLQHYEESFVRLNGRTLQEEQDNDKIKEQLAMDNGIDKYIVVDCRKSEFEWVKDSIIKSVGRYIDLSVVDWCKCEEFALSNLIKVACDYKKNNPLYGTSKIGELLDKDKSTVHKWLVKGSKLGWCNYNPKEEIRRGMEGKTPYNARHIEVFKSNESVGVYESATSISKNSLSEFGVKFDRRYITRRVDDSDCLYGKPYKGIYTFRELSKEEYNEYLNSQNLKEVV